MARTLKNHRLLFSPQTLNTQPFVRHFNIHSRSLETLAFEEIQANKDKPYNATAFVLHGLLGSGRNWRSFSRNLVSDLANSPSNLEWRMVLVDLRNHGRSADIKGILPPHDLANAAKDLADLVEAQGWDWPNVVMGHSLGGKVALQYVESCARGDYGDSAVVPKQYNINSRSLETVAFEEVQANKDKPYNATAFVLQGLLGSGRNWRSFSCNLVSSLANSSSNLEQLLVLDSVVGEMDPEYIDGEVEKVLRTLQSLPTAIPSRKWLVDHMIGLGFSKSLSEWIGSNIKKSGDHETWSFNLQGAVEMFESYQEKSYWSLLENPPEGIKIAVVRAEQSDRWAPSVVQRLESLSSKSDGRVAIPVLPNSGHWVHVDNPKGLLDIIAPSIKILS